MLVEKDMKKEKADLKTRQLFLHKEKELIREEKETERLMFKRKK